MNLQDLAAEALTNVGPRMDFGLDDPPLNTDSPAAYPEDQVWSDWTPFQRSSNISMARYKLRQQSGNCVWQVIFGGKARKPTKKFPNGGTTPISMYEYGPSPHLDEKAFWEWFNQYAQGGSAGIWLDLNVKRMGVPARQLATQGA